MTGTEAKIPAPGAGTVPVYPAEKTRRAQPDAPPPRSCVGLYDPLLSAGVAAGLFAACRDLPWSDTELALCLCLAVTFLLCGVEIARTPWRSRKRPSLPLSTVAYRSAIKVLGALAGLGCCMAGWSVLPEYAQKAYAPFFEAMNATLPYALAATVACILFTEWRLGGQKDYAWHLGMLVTGRRRRADWRMVRKGLLCWLIRGFFLPLNFSALAAFVGAIRHADMAGASWPQAVAITTTAIWALMAAAIIPGYLLGSRLFGTEVRKVEQSWFGWTVTLSCYPPFLHSVFGMWFNFGAGGETAWASLLQSFPTALLLAGIAILLLEAIHYWAEAAFGLRASNLCNRGIITNGPYRYCKHPVYLVKCVSWCLACLPFAAGENAWDCLRLALLFGGVCGIYFMRAWVEERLLGDDPVYVSYALWMDRRGLFAPVGRALPFMRFAWRLERWQRENTLANPVQTAHS